jgi:hypothetical protein
MLGVGVKRSLMLIAINIEFWTNIGLSIAAIFGGLMMGIGYVKGKYKSWSTSSKNKEDHHEEIIDIKSAAEGKHNHIHEMLTSLRFHTNSDRAQIGQFHNGGKFLEGSAMKRFSISHESCSPGVSMEFHSLQGILATLFWDMIEILKQDDPKIRFTQSLPDETVLKTYNESKNIQAFAMLPIKKNDLYIGFVKVDWNDKNTLPDDPEDGVRLMQQYCSFIELEITKKG